MTDPASAAAQDAAVAATAGELYRAPLAEFVATRSALAGRLKKEGNATAAAAVTALRKPSVSTWLVDQLATQSPDQVRELLAAAWIVRHATAAGRSGDADAVRDASLRFRNALDAVGRKLRRVAEASGRGAADDMLRRAQLTAHAAAVGDPGKREGLLRGTLNVDLEPPGFGVPGPGDADTPLVHAAIADLVEARRASRKARDAGASAPRSAAAAKQRAERDAATAQADVETRRAEREAAALQLEAERLTAMAERLRARADRLAAEARDAEAKANAAEEAMMRAQEAATAARSSSDGTK